MRVTPVRLEDFNVLLGKDLLPYFKSAEGDFMWLLLTDEQDDEGWLILGDIQPHLTLLIFGVLQASLSSTPDIGAFRRRYIETKAKNDEFRDTHMPRIRGGGACDREGTVSRWDSLTFKKETPEELRPGLEEKLKESVPQYFREDEVVSGKIVLPFPPDKP